MALRSLGATLLAKSGTGSSLRRLEEQSVGGAVPAANAQAQANSAARKSVDQPMEVSVPGGTEKNIAVKPIIQPNVSNIAPPAGQGLVPQMGGGAMAAATGVNINTPVAPVSAPVGMRTASTVSAARSPAKAAASPFTDSIMGVGAKNAPAQTNSWNPVSVPFSLGNRTSAETGQGNQEVGRSLIQGAAATIANAIQGGGVDKKATNPVSQALINFANTPSKAKTTGIKSNIDKAYSNVQKAVQQAPSVAQNVAQKVSNTVQKASSWLRSLFR